MEETLKELAQAFAEFKIENDKRLDEIKKNGHADPLLEKKVDTINAKITALEEKAHNQGADISARVEELENQRLRPDLGSVEDSKAEIQDAKIFFATSRRMKLKDVSIGEPELKQYREYKDAIFEYFRFGDAIPAEIKNVLSVGVDSEGGYWVTPDMGGRIETLIYESSPIRQEASVQTIGTGSMKGFNDLDEADSGWVGEKQARTDTDEPDIGEYEITVREQYAQPKATQTMLDDGMVNVEQWLNAKVARKFARAENTAFVNGDGVLRPRGFLTYAAGTPSAAAWNVIQQINSGAAGAFAGTDPGDYLIDLVFALKADYRGNAKWYMSRSTVAEARKLKDGQGNYMWQNDFTQLAGARLLGYPIVEAEDMPAIAADSLSIAFGDMRAAYQILDRAGIRILRDPFTDKPNIRFYTTKRVGGDVTNFEAIKIMKFAA